MNIGLGQTTPDVEILLVDDREENLLALEAVLQAPGYRLVKAGSGDHALRYLLENRPALILLDVQMPGLDGFATAAIIKGSERTREIPIIFLTALNKDEQILQRGYEHGAVDYLYKPFDAQILRSKVAVFADLHRKNELLLIAERKLMENERRERERHFAEMELKSLRRTQVEQRRYRELVEGINHGVVWATDARRFNLTFISPRAEDVFGHPPEAWFKEPRFWERHVYPEDRLTFAEKLAGLNPDGEGVSFEHRAYRADGSVIWLHTGMRLSSSGEPGEREIRGISIDITRLKDAERALEQGKRRSELLAEVGLGLAQSLDPAATLSEAAALIAEGFCSFVAIQGADGTGALRTLAMAHRDPLPHAQAQRLLARWEPCSEFPAPVCYARRAGGDGLAFSREQASFVDSLGLQSGLVLALVARGQRIGTLALGSTVPGAFGAAETGLAEDLSFRLAAALDNGSLYREAQKAVRMRDEFLSIASHELKTPLTPLKIQTQQLLRLISKDSLAAVEPARVNRMLEISNRQIERLNKLIEDLLDISRISTGKMGLRIEQFDLMELLHDLGQRFSAHLGAAGCEFRLSGPAHLCVRWDSFRIEQVLVNLLTNAAKYAPGKPVEFAVTSEAGGVQVSVRDQGMGIAHEDQDRIFQRFERAVSGTHFGGLGLGLYISTQIAEAHGGRIWVESELGAGSTFHLQLPLESAGESTEDLSAPPPFLAAANLGALGAAGGGREPNGGRATTLATGHS